MIFNSEDWIPASKILTCNHPNISDIFGIPKEENEWNLDFYVLITFIAYIWLLYQLPFH